MRKSERERKREREEERGRELFVEINVLHIKRKMWEMNWLKV